LLDINSDEMLLTEFKRMMRIAGARGVLLQPMLSGIELFLGAVKEPGYGHVIMCGIGGIFVEVMEDVSSALAPVTRDEALDMIKSLKGFRMFEGIRGQTWIDENVFAEIMVRFSALLQYADRILEVDINPLIAERDKIIAVDARIRLEK
jgi:acetyltransferase